MKRIALLILVILPVFLLCGCNRQAKQIARNDAEYLAAVDSLNKAMRELVEWNNRELAGKYESISTEGFKSAFGRRLIYSRDQLDSIYNAAPRILRRSVAGQAIHEFLYGLKVRPGEKIIPFDCFDVDGEAFDWSVIEGKNYAHQVPSFAG